MIGIYKITSPTNKVYIGQSINISKRWEQYVNPLFYSVGPKLINSLNKHSFKNHKFEIIEECTIEQLNERETYWKQHYIDLLGWDKVLFCELHDKGSGPKSEETKLKQSKGLKNSYKTGKRKAYWQNKKRPEHSSYMKENSGFKYIRTPYHNEIKIKSIQKAFKEKGKEIGKKISQSKKGKGVKSIKCNETGIIYSSITECSEQMNISKGIICSFVKGNYKYNTIKGFTFSYI